MDQAAHSQLSEKTEALSTHSRDETFRWAEQFAKTLQSGTVIALCGELGAGKTVVAKGVGKGLGIIDEIISPTFNYILEYHGKHIPLYHADLYRIENSRIFSAMGFAEYFEKPGIFLIEWAERIADILPAHTIFIDLAVGESENERRITIRRSQS